jgi:hypothetical protein
MQLVDGGYIGKYYQYPNKVQCTYVCQVPTLFDSTLQRTSVQTASWALEKNSFEQAINQSTSRSLSCSQA